MRKVPTWCHFANLSPLVSSEPHVLQDTWFNIWTSSTSWVMFEMPLLPLQQYVEQVNRIGTPSHVRNLRPLYPPYSTIHPTDGLSWHVDLFVLNFPGLFLRNAMFNVWIKMASWIILEFPFLARQSNTLKTWKHILSHFWNLQPLDPTKQYI